VRFTCPKCGKRYASSAEPAPGKAYRLKCKACGEAIVLRAGGVASSAPTPAPGAISSAAPPPRPRPAAPAAAQRTPTPTPEPTPGSTATQPVASPLELPVPPVTPTSAVASPLPPPPPGDTAVDPAPGESSTPKGAIPEDDPFAAAARASLPEGYGAAARGAAPDPIAALAHDPTGTVAGPVTPRREPAPPTFAAMKPPRARISATVVLLAAGVLVLLAVLAFAMLRGNAANRAEPPAAKPTAAQGPAQP
jgi:hypothetical protein